MKKLTCISLLMLIVAGSYAQETKSKNKLFYGMYLQWGYNLEWYTKSNIHFKMANGDDFVLHHARAKDKPDFHSITKNPLEISLPQYNYRIGFYLNKQKTRSVEINFDHIKYVVTDGQKVHVTGTINNQKVDGDSVLNSASFLHLEHTDGGNLLHINYVQQNTLLHTKGTGRQLLNLLWKAGAGINIPRTDFTYHGDKLNNNFHIAGFNASAEAGVRLYPFRHFFVEGTGKTGYVRYLNALANTTSLKGSRVRHGFAYFETIATLGFDITF
ncbi:MAG: hypothetical protein QM687_12980 [Ferruginibacter sp.]